MFEGSFFSKCIMIYGHIFKFLNEITVCVHRHRWICMTNTKIYFENKPEGIIYPILSYRNILTYFTQPCQMAKKEKKVGIWFIFYPGLPHVKSSEIALTEELFIYTSLWILLINSKTNLTCCKSRCY